VIRAAVLAGIGSCLPPRIVPNSELAPALDSSDEWIRSRTGIEQRHFAENGMATSDLAAGAGSQALGCAGPGGADMVIVATTTPDRPCPATAPTVAAKLGLTGVAAYDVSAVCTGFLYGLATAAGLIAGEVAERVLVIGAETFSTILNPADRSTAVIFGDGAGAVLLRAGRPDEAGAIGSFDLGSDGGGRDLITIRAGGSCQRLSGITPEPEDQFFTMAGREVFWNAVSHMEQSAKAALGRAGWPPADVDWLVGHQANIRILDRLAEALGIPGERSITNLAQVGNTAAASIPLALHHAYAQGRLRAGDRILLTAFGGGLTWGSTTLTWPDIGESA
jgi:3-oxoacyl-[acyl-carrier-protein] synthase-3